MVMMRTPPLAILDGIELAYALRAGIDRVFSAQQHLDRINVFPVADGDTGTNLAFTLSAVRASLIKTTAAHAGERLAQIADAAIDGARGNSGAILAEFLQGIAEEAAQDAQLIPIKLARAVSNGAKSARGAVIEPRDGTMLSIFDAFSNELLLKAADVSMDLSSVWECALDAAQRALINTPMQLSALKDAGVVDAGAAGVVALLEGMSQYLKTGELVESSAALVADSEESDHAGSEVHLEHRWCTECMVTSEAIELRALRERLSTLGSSLVVAGSRRKARIHIHTNNPQAIFRAALDFGAVTSEKADDMQRQQESALHAAKRTLAIVTDSAADLPEELLERFDIHVVPIRIHFGATSFLDKVSLSTEAFYTRLAASEVAPKTSQPPAGDFRRLYGFLGSHYAHVLSVHVSGKVSGTLQSAQTAAGRAREVNSEHSITVIDSLNASAGQALLLMHAAECADAGMGLQDLINSLCRMRKRTRTFAYLADLNYAVRGGRVPPAVRTIANTLHIAPLLVTRKNGKIGVGGFLFGRKNATVQFARFILRQLKKARAYRLIVAHGNDPAAGATLLALLKIHPSVRESWLVGLGTALGVHGGPGTLVVGLQDMSSSD